ncbi:MAG: hypothetical protein QM781_18725 [Chitinophagaceae bacterium]
MSRIRAIDRIFSKIPRAYVNFGDHHRKDIDGVPVACEENVVQYNLNANEPSHQLIFDQLLQKASFCYVHTVHLAINVVNWLATGKIIVDIHGIVPEEEIMLGRPDQAERFAPVEEMVLMYCNTLVAVTNAMKDHLIRKYPKTTANFIILPIFEEYNIKKKITSNSDDDRHPRIVYAGGTQVWQNVDLMMSLVKNTHEYVDYTFISHDQELLKQKAKELKLGNRITIRSATKAELPDIYMAHDFGFVLRDETAVNTVSCPTKLSEYLDFGIVPIVKYASLGDFDRFGYSYITEDDLSELMLPDSVCRRGMIQKNYAAIESLIHEYKNGSERLKDLV